MNETPTAKFGYNETGAFSKFEINRLIFSQFFPSKNHSIAL